MQTKNDIFFVFSSKTNAEYKQELTKIFNRYSQLISEYHRYKSDYENLLKEEKNEKINLLVIIDFIFRYLSVLTKKESEFTVKIQWIKTLTII